MRFYLIVWKNWGTRSGERGIKSEYGENPYGIYGH